MSKAEKHVVDWEAVELDYRAGVLTFSQMATQHGVSKGRISQVAKEKGWTRDVSAKIRARVEDQLNNAALNGSVNDSLNAKQEATEQEVIEANAHAITQIVLGHRTKITKAQRIVDLMLDELDHQTLSRDLYEQLGELMLSPDEKGMDKLNEIYSKSMALPSRVGNVKALSETLKNLISLERQAFNIDGTRDGDPSQPDSVPVIEAARRMAFLLTAGAAQIDKEKS